MNNTFSYDDGMTDALKEYLNLKKNVDPVVELRRRGKNVGMRLVRIFKKNAPSAAKIKSDATKRGFKLKTRQSVLKKKLPRAAQIAAEIKARTNARGFTATGWFPAIESLGGTPKIEERVKGPKRGRLVEKRGLADASETLINEQPGAAHTAEINGNAMQEALNAERDDMIKYIMRKQDQAARRNGL